MAKMIYCKTCGAQIAKNAKTCPHCGARNKKHGFLKILLAVIILGGIGGAVSGGRGNRTQPTGQAAVQPEVMKETETNAQPEETQTMAAQKQTEAESQSVTTAEDKVEDAKTVEEKTAGTAAIEKETLHQDADIEKSANEEKTSDGVTPELKEFLDQYEKCIDEYCNFMESFDANSSDPMAILKYTSLMQEYLDFAEKAKAYDEKEMTNEDLKYYIDVIARIEKRMLDVTVK